MTPPLPRIVHPPWPRWLVAGAVVGLYLAACATPAVSFETAEEAARPAWIRLGPLSGLTALLWGYWPPFGVPWLANWLLLAGCIYLLAGNYRRAAWSGVFGTVLALTTWCMQIPRLLIGYYLWHGSMVVLAVGSAWLVSRGSHGPRSAGNRENLTENGTWGERPQGPSPRRRAREDADTRVRRWEA